MPTRQYTFMFALAVASWQQAASIALDGKDPGAALSSTTARAGQFKNPVLRSANDSKIAAFLACFFIVSVWSRVIYRANLRGIGRNGAENFQMADVGFLPFVVEVTLWLQWFRESQANFSSPSACAKRTAPPYFVES